MLCLPALLILGAGRPAGSAFSNHRVPQAFVSLNWVLSEEPLDLETELGLDFLDYLLVCADLVPSSTTQSRDLNAPYSFLPKSSHRISKESHRPSDRNLGLFRVCHGQASQKACGGQKKLRTCISTACE